MSLADLADPAVSPFVAMLLLAAAPNIALRVVGVFLSRGMNEESEALAFIRALATALLAGVVGKLLAAPPGALAATSLGARIAALALAMAVFRFAGRSLWRALLAGEAALIASLLVGL
jgi:hypothetical protein